MLYSKSAASFHPVLSGPLNASLRVLGQALSPVESTDSRCALAAYAGIRFSERIHDNVVASASRWRFLNSLLVVLLCDSSRVFNTANQFLPAGGANRSPAATRLPRSIGHMSYVQSRASGESSTSHFWYTWISSGLRGGLNLRIMSDTLSRSLLMTTSLRDWAMSASSNHLPHGGFLISTFSLASRFHLGLSMCLQVHRHGLDSSPL